MNFISLYGGPVDVEIHTGFSNTGGTIVVFSGRGFNLEVYFHRIDVRHEAGTFYLDFQHLPYVTGGPTLSVSRDQLWDILTQAKRYDRRE